MKTTQVRDVCSTCKWWDAEGIGKARRLGKCRRNPPLALSEIVQVASWPKTQSSDWCGEYKADPKPINVEDPTAV